MEMDEWKGGDEGYPEGIMEEEEDVEGLGMEDYGQEEGEEGMCGQ